MIARTWHGWTDPEHAEAYQRLLIGEIVPGIMARRIPGLVKFQVHRRNLADGEVEFTTVMWFESLGAVRAFAGEDYEAAVVPAAARALLRRFDARSRHDEVVASWSPQPGPGPGG